MSYTRKPEDKEYRKIPLDQTTIPAFQPFATPEQRIDYPRSCVLEIKREDGSVFLDYSYGRQGLGFYTSEGRDQFNLPKDAPTARLWLRRIDGSGIKYKVPLTLKEVGDRKFVYIPGGTAAVELFGDAYFEAAYELKRR